MVRMFNPPHPGTRLKEDVLPALGLSMTAAALQLGVTRAAFSRVINGRAAISPEMARRLELWLKTRRGGPDTERWPRQQLAYGLWQEEQRPTPEVQRAPAVRVSRPQVLKRPLRMRGGAGLDMQHLAGVAIRWLCPAA
jgi:addiction module HigA family antidote